MKQTIIHDLYQFRFCTIICIEINRFFDRLYLRVNIRESICKEFICKFVCQVKRLVLLDESLWLEIEFNSQLSLNIASSTDFILYLKMEKICSWIAEYYLMPGVSTGVHKFKMCLRSKDASILVKILSYHFLKLMRTCNCLLGMFIQGRFRY